jgi:PE family
MSFVSGQPEALTAGAGTLQGIGSSMSAQNAAAAGPTTRVVPAAADEVSALTAVQFGLLQMFDVGAPVKHIRYVPARPDVSGRARPSGCDS